MVSLKNLRKWIIPLLAIVFLVISIFVYGLRWWFPRDQIDWQIILFLFTFIALFEITALILNPKILKNSIDLLKDQMVVKALQRKDLTTLVIIFPLTMLFEELLFRLFIFVTLFVSLDLFFATTIGTLSFSIYHIHIWFEFKNKKILSSFILFSALLGFILNLMVYYIGLFACVVIHLISVLWLFQNISKKINLSYSLS
ncbi:MAG: CPBP family intramembrane metalloprotease [Candidatus Lokiarchaeota archaeon]|nr:CPBP family intramembrane metalloprotease [Candidatus Lokiarchaeota archaeon]